MFEIDVDKNVRMIHTYVYIHTYKQIRNFFIKKIHVK